MTKIWKRSVIGLLTAIFSLVVGALVFTACGKTPNDAVTYTVTVRVDETTPVSDVKVTIGKGGARFDTKETDANGKAEFELVPDSYEVTLSALPDHYSVPEDANLSFTADNRSLTITLAENFAYRVNLVNPDNTPYYAAGVTVGICTLTGNCLTPQPLDTNGLARCEGAKGDYHVQILGLPETAVFEKDADGYYTEKNFSATETEMTITIYPVTSITSATAMTDSEKTAFAAKYSGYTADSDLNAYHFEKQLGAGESAYYAITPTVSGDYQFYRNDTAYYSYSDFGLGFSKQGNMFPAEFNMQAGKTYYFNVNNTGDSTINAEFVMEEPAASYSKITKAGTVNVTISKADTNAVIEITPEKGSSYKLTAQGANLAIASCASSYYAENYSHEENAYKTNPECSDKLTEDKIGGSLYFSVAVKNAASYPFTFEVTVEKIADLKNTTNVVPVTETLKAFDDVTDKYLTALPYGSTLYYDTVNHYYRLNDATGPAVVVMLTENAERLDLVGGLVYLEEENPGLRNSPYIFDVTSNTDKADMEKGNTYNDYRTMLRGFADYQFKPNSQGGYDYVRPSVKGQNCYANYVNSDGVYPLTKELETFLKAFAAANEYSILSATAGNEWQFACYYYSDEAPAENDIIVGKYEQVSMAGTKTLTVNADGTYSIFDGTGTTSGTWKKNSENNYTFTEIIVGWDPFDYAVTRDASTGKLTFEDSNNPDEPAYEFEVLATDPVVGNYSAGKRGPTLTVNADGTYVINDGMRDNPGTWVKNSDNNYTFTDDDKDWGNTYTVTRDEDTGMLTFVDSNEEETPYMPIEN